VSLDDPEKNKEFAESLGAKHVLLSDPGKEVAKAYGVLAMGGLFAKRWTFYVAKDGSVAYVDRDVKVDRAGQDIARKLGELGFAKKK
jgi:peroxiredoxin Q/BCP